MNYKAFFSDNDVLTDLSINVNDYYSGNHALSMVATEDYIYFGARHPFNSLYIKLSTKNITTTILNVEYWEGNEWVSCVELIDKTDGFKQDGYLQFVPDRKYSWMREDTVDSSGNARIAELSDVTIYDRYWIRITTSENITFTLDWVGQLFCTDNDLFTEYPSLNNTTLMEAIESGKTDWEAQHMRATSVMIDDLISDGVIDDQGQLLDVSKMVNACLCKTAEIIYNLLGDDYVDNAIRAKERYIHRKDKGIYFVDSNSNADLDETEKRARQGFVWR